MGGKAKPEKPVNLCKPDKKKTDADGNEIEEEKEPMGLKEYMLKKFNELEPYILRNFSE